MVTELWWVWYHLGQTVHVMLWSNYKWDGTCKLYNWKVWFSRTDIFNSRFVVVFLCWTDPAGTWRRKDIVMTSMWRSDVNATSKRRIDISPMSLPRSMSVVETVFFRFYRSFLFSYCSAFGWLCFIWCLHNIYIRIGIPVVESYRCVSETFCCLFLRKWSQCYWNLTSSSQYIYTKISIIYFEKYDDPNFTITRYML